MENNYATVGYVNFLFAIFCVHWARAMGKSAWGWFFFGLFLAPIAGIVMAAKGRSAEPVKTA